jgi:hypothetical protein
MSTDFLPRFGGAIFIGSAVSLYRSKFPDWLAGAVRINRHTLDLLCNNDCGGVGSIGHDAPLARCVVASPGPPLQHGGSGCIAAIATAPSKNIWELQPEDVSYVVELALLGVRSS